MAEKRRMTTRYGGEPPPKRRESTPPPQTPTTTPKKSPQSARTQARKEKPRQAEKAVEKTKKTLPSKLTDNASLPTLKERQPLHLSTDEYKSIKASRVLATAIQRSRNRWIYGGVLKRHWTKPSKKKHQAGEINIDNPARDTMRMIGQCTLTVEPHIFDVILYGVKQDLPLMTSGQQAGPRQTPVHRTSYGPQKEQWQMHPSTYQPSNMPPTWQEKTAASGNGSVPHSNTPQVRQQHQPHERLGQTQPQNHAPTAVKVDPVANTGQTPAPAPAPYPPYPSQPSYRNQPHRPVAPHHPHGPAPSSDPVIHMLAQRAGHDPQLKSVMKIVAAGEASPEQLQFFQRHIDELTSLLQARTNAGLPPIPVSSSTRPPFHPGSGPGPAPTQTYLPPRQPYGSDAHGTGSRPAQFAPQNHAPLQPRAHFTSSPKPYQQLQHVKRNTNSPMRIESYSSVLIEFVGGTGDRYLFPRNSILEYLPGQKHVIASFLLLGDEKQVINTSSNNNRTSPNKNFYEPVTVRFASEDPRILAPFARAVEHPDQVRRYMNDIMDKVPRAEQAFLALRLPKNGDADESVDEYSREDSIARSMTPVGQPAVRKPRGPYKKRVKIVETPVEPDKGTEQKAG